MRVWELNLEIILEMLSEQKIIYQLYKDKENQRTLVKIVLLLMKLN